MASYLKLPRTIADLAASEWIETSHLVEAIQYRTRRQWQGYIMLHPLSIEKPSAEHIVASPCCQTNLES